MRTTLFILIALSITACELGPDVLPSQGEVNDTNGVAILENPTNTLSETNEMVITNKQTNNHIIQTNEQSNQVRPVIPEGYLMKDFYDHDDSAYSTGFYWYPKSSSSFIKMSESGPIMSRTHTLFDPDKPTIIFIHGWSDVRDPGIYETFKYAGRLVAKGYNVAYFRWPMYTWEEAGHGNGAEWEHACRVVKNVWKSDGAAAVFRQALKDNLLNGVAENYRDDGYGNKTYTYEQLKDYTGEITIVAHSTGAQVTTLAMDDYALMTKRPMKIVLADPYFPGDQDRPAQKPIYLGEAEYQLEKIEPIIRRLYLQGHAVYWLASTFIGRDSYINVENANGAYKLKDYITTVSLQDNWNIYVFPDRINTQSWQQLLDLRARHKGDNYQTLGKDGLDVYNHLQYPLYQIFKTTYMVSSASQPLYGEIRHGYAIDWAMEMILNQYEAKYYYTEGFILKCKTWYIPTPFSSIAKIRAHNGRIYKQYMQFPWNGTTIGGNHTFKVTDDDFEKVSVIL